MSIERIIECVPNFSEGRNPENIKAIVSAIEDGGRLVGTEGSVKILNVDPGYAANRTVITFAGSPEAVVEAAFQGVKKAGEVIDMRTHSGEHPRSGATDVLPLVPISGVTLEECAELARKLAQRIYQELGIPCYCYEAAAYKEKRRNLAVCRAGEYEALAEKILDPERRPDFGPETYTEKVAMSGATNVGARNFLIAVNFNLNTTSVPIAKEIACEVREKGKKGEDGTMIPGKLKGCKAIGWYIEEYGIAQVSMNITDINATPLHVAYEQVCKSAQERGYEITGTEIIGLVPKRVHTEAGLYFLRKEGANSDMNDLHDEQFLMEAAIKFMGLDELRPYNPQERVIEYLIEDMKRPKVSVVTSFFNEPLQWIVESVESVLNQTFKDFEFVMICDNPDYKDGIEYIRKLQKKDDRIRFICNTENIGLTKSLNIGIAAARGEYIARLDADDICLPERLEMQVAYLDANPHVSVCASNAHIIDVDGKICRRNRYINKTNPAELLISNILAHPSIMMRKNLIEIRRPLYNEEFIYSQDYELWQHLFLKGIEPHILKEPLILYRKSSIQISVAQRRQQVNFFKKAHKLFITSWLKNRGIVKEVDEDNLQIMLSKASDAYNKVSGNDKIHLAHIIYVLYFSLASYNKKYKWLYLLDRNLIAFRVKIIFSFRLFFSRKTRKDRTGFN